MRKLEHELAPNSFFTVKKTVRELRKGELFTKKSIERPTESQVWIRSGYDRAENAFECTRYSDISDSCLMAGDKVVYTGFTF